MTISRPPGTVERPADRAESANGPSRRLSPRFGDIVKNGWASERNPTRIGYFVREGRRTGKMNPGRYFEVTDGNGKFWELSPRGDHRITVVHGILADLRFIPSGSTHEGDRNAPRAAHSTSNPPRERSEQGETA